MRYLCLVYPGEDFKLTAPTVAEFLSFRDAASEAGVFIDSGRLQPPTATTTVLVRQGETVLTDGPFAELKEQVGGYVLLDCADLDEAVKWTAMVPGVKDGAAEIRPLVEMPL
jgi:hypothetical protein